MELKSAHFHFQMHYYAIPKKCCKSDINNHPYLRLSRGGYQPKQRTPHLLLLPGHLIQSIQGNSSMCPGPGTCLQHLTQDAS